MKVDNVKDEYEYTRNQTCSNCGLKGTYKVEMQRLVFSREIPCDELDCICMECGNKKTYIFDISQIWEGYKEKFDSNE